MEYNVLGGTLLLGVGAWIAHGSLQSDRRRLAVLDAWIALIRSMRWEIESRLTPIDRFFTSADKRLLGMLGKSDAKTLSELLSASAPDLSPNAKESLSRFAESLGDCYRTEQLRRCDECLESLRREQEKQAAELPSKRRMGLALPLSLALGIAILLW